MAHTVEQSRVVPVSVEEAFDGTLPLPLPQLFRHWYGPIPPIKQVLGQTGEWQAVGQTRTVRLTGGGSMREELISVDRPRSFEYRLTDIKGPLAPLVHLVEGRWLFTPTGTSATVTWRWVIHPRSALATPAMPVLGWLWKGYARRALAQLAALLEG
ncbi:MAG TPA: SRPBCC family protein [Mycobacterium sp.]|nr:SRPBCC family protein [Mycobacterium sp.]